VKSATVSNVSLDQSKLKLKYLHPDYEGLRATIAKALEHDPVTTTPPPVTPTPGKPTALNRPGAPAATPPGPTEDLRDACAYHPAGAQNGG
jgi:hypothetical protein